MCDNYEDCCHLNCNDYEPVDYLPGTDDDDPIIRLRMKYMRETEDDFIENIPKYADWLENEILTLL